MSDHFFPYAFDRRYKVVWCLAGARDGIDGVTITDDDRLVATYGRLRVETSLDNVADAHVTGPYRWWKSVGVRLSLADDGLTFGTSAGPGACIHFRERVRRAVGFRDSSALTVTVADPDGLVAALEGRAGADD